MPANRFLAGLVLGAALLAPAAAGAQTADSAAFIIRLGDDTVAVERYVRTGERVVAEAVQRSPSTILHRMTWELGDDGRVTRAEWSASRPGEQQPLGRRVVTFQGDSAVIETGQAASPRTQTVAAANAIPIAGPFYTPYELVLMRAAAAGEPTVEVPLLTGGGTVDIPIRREGVDSVTLTNQFGEPMSARVDESGRLLGLGTPAYTTVERLPWIDLEALTREYAARDESGRGMGPLSPRHTYRVSVDGANLWMDYSQPGMRGRPIWGGLVPWGEVWRMGANVAAHLSTDRPLSLGGLDLEPGTYTLFLLPSEQEWTLIVNRQTGISGLEHDPADDVGRVPMRVESVEEPAESFTIDVEDTDEGGELALRWARTRATVPFTVR